MNEFSKDKNLTHQENVQVPTSAKTSQPSKLSAKPFIAIIFLLLVVIGYGVYHQNHLSNQISILKKNQLPTKQFSDVDSCANNGGITLNTVNAQFNACLEGGDQVILQYSSQNLPQVTTHQTTTTPNVVVASSNSTSDLINYLTYSYSGCSMGQPKGVSETGYYKVVKEIPSGWALLNYGCSNDTQAEKNSTYIIAMKLSSGWVQLSPTNNFLPNGTPSCILVDMYKIPESLTGQCFQNTGYNNGTLRKDSNP